MAYKINKTDGSLLTEVLDSTFDHIATDLTLIGKNASNFGEHLNENFVKLLENFASTSQPNNPLTGQIWYDTSELRLKVYSGQQWKQSSGPIVSATAPLSANLTQGDFWIDSAENQVYFYDGEEGLQLAGPVYKKSQGVSGFEVRTIKDSNNIARVILILWLGGSVLGIFSKNTVNFTIPTGIFSEGVVNNPIKPGFNICNIPAGGPTVLKLNATAAAAQTLTLSNNQTVSGDSFVRNDTLESTMQGTLNLISNNSLKLGPTGQISIGVNLQGQLTILGVISTIKMNDKLRLPIYTTASRDARTDKENGEIIYNSSVNKVQAYANNVWVDLH
jgi:hypothetical protein